MDMDKLLEATVQNGGSDLHIRAGTQPKLRIEGHLRSLGNQELTTDDTLSLAKSIAGEKQMQELEEFGSTDFGLAFREGTRFRVSVFKHQGRVGVVLRQIPNTLMSFEDLGVPEVIREICLRPRGLFLVTGPTGSGKTTTLSSMIDHINQNRHDHIITIEDPIEFVHPHKKCVVSQREIGADTPGFAEALRRALRQDPDIILVGEMRDLETISAAITAAETGHLVFGTLHTTGAAATINRIVDAFPTNQQEQIRTQLAGGLVGVLSQQLLAKKGGGRIAAYEMMVCNSAIAHLIRKNETFKIDSIIQTGSDEGMILLDDYLFNLYRGGKVGYKDMLSRAKNSEALDQKARQFRDEMQKRKGR
jgi:twitching motility protein PilT